MKILSTRRMYRRVLVEYPSCYLTSSSLRQSIVRDVSLNGLRIEGRPGLQLNTMVMVQLWLPGREGSIDIDQAVVRWVRGCEFGIQIVALSNEADLRLATHVELILQRKTVNA
jgi:PilZ domain